MKKILLILVFLGLFLGQAFAAITGDEARHLFVKADSAYKDAKYRDAASFYEQIIAGGLESGPLYFNLGNSYFKQGDLGRAILNYERSRKIIPRDGDLRANRSYAISQIKGVVLSSSRPFWQKALDKSGEAITSREVFWVLFLVFVLAAQLHVISLYFPFLRARANLVLFFLGMLIAISGAGGFARNEYENGQAIILGETSAKFEPRDQATSYFELYPGQKVKVVKEEGLWCKVERVDGKMGWVPKEKFEKI